MRSLGAAANACDLRSDMTWMIQEDGRSLPKHVLILSPKRDENFVVWCHDWQSWSTSRMSAVDLAASHMSSGSKEFDESDLYEPAASTLGSRYKRVFRSKSSVAAVDRHPNSDLKVVKLEVKPQPAGRSGLLAAQLKGSASHSNLPLSASSNSVHSRKRADKAEVKPSLPTVNEVSSASLESTTSAVQLPLPASPCSGNTSPLAVPTKRQNRSQWSLAEADDDFVPPHLLTTQTLPSDFVFAEESRPGSVLEGVGRKLRGSDAERFRQAVMRQTGFLEPKSTHRLPAG